MALSSLSCGRDDAGTCAAQLMILLCARRLFPVAPAECSVEGFAEIVGG